MTITVQRLQSDDFSKWQPLWQGYADFLETTVADDITKNTFSRMVEPGGKVGGFLAVDEHAQAVGFVTFILHPTTFAINDRLYLEDLFTSATHRGRGVARRLIEAVVVKAEECGADKVYWQTEESNYAGRMLYDKMAEKTHIIYTRKIKR